MYNEHIQDSEALSPDAQGAGFGANDVLFLALYVILLAFFIVLNANASISEKKTLAVIETFRPQIVPVRAPDDTGTIAADPVEERLKRVFDTHLPSGEWRLVTRDGHIDVLIPAHRAFAADSSVLQPGRIAMVRKLAAVLGEAQSVDGLRLQLATGGSSNDLARRRAASLARDLVRNGVMADRFEAGVDTAAGDRIRFRLIPDSEGS